MIGAESSENDSRLKFQHLKKSTMKLKKYYDAKAKKNCLRADTLKHTVYLYLSSCT